VEALLILSNSNLKCSVNKDGVSQKFEN